MYKFENIQDADPVVHLSRILGCSLHSFTQGLRLRCSQGVSWWLNPATPSLRQKSWKPGNIRYIWIISGKYYVYLCVYIYNLCMYVCMYVYI